MRELNNYHQENAKQKINEKLFCSCETGPVQTKFTSRTPYVPLFEFMKGNPLALSQE